MKHEEPYTPRQIDVLECLCRGFTANEVAEHLGISPKTVEAITYQIRLAKGGKNTTHIVAQYMEYKFKKNGTD